MSLYKRAYRPEFDVAPVYDGSYARSGDWSRYGQPDLSSPESCYKFVERMRLYRKDITKISPRILSQAKKWTEQQQIAKRQAQRAQGAPQQTQQYNQGAPGPYYDSGQTAPFFERDLDEASDEQYLTEEELGQKLDELESDKALAYRNHQGAAWERKHAGELLFYQQQYAQTQRNTGDINQYKSIRNLPQEQREAALVKMLADKAETPMRTAEGYEQLYGNLSRAELTEIAKKDARVLEWAYNTGRLGVSEVYPNAFGASSYNQGAPQQTQQYNQGAPQAYNQGVPQTYNQGAPQAYNQGAPQQYNQGAPRAANNVRERTPEQLADESTRIITGDPFYNEKFPGVDKLTKEQLRDFFISRPHLAQYVIDYDNRAHAYMQQEIGRRQQEKVNRQPTTTTTQGVNSLSSRDTESVNPQAPAPTQSATYTPKYSDADFARMNAEQDQIASDMYNMPTGLSLSGNNNSYNNANATPAANPVTTPAAKTATPPVAKPAAPAANPVAPAANTVAPAANPVAPAAKTATPPVAKPADPAAKPAAPAANPVAPAANPVAPAAKPATPPVAKPAAPAANPVVPAAKPAAPAANPVAPAANTVAPAANTVAPAANTVAPAANTVAPAAKPVTTARPSILDNLARNGRRQAQRRARGDNSARY